MAHLEAVDISQKKCIRGEGKLDVRGYCRKSRFNKVWYAHRLAYSDANGGIPTGYHVHHLCDNKSCINPSHLVALTPTEHREVHSLPKAAKYYSELQTCKYGHSLDLIVGKHQQRACSVCHKKRNLIYKDQPRIKAKITARDRKWKAANRQRINEQQAKRRMLKKELTNVLS